MNGFSWKGRRSFWMLLKVENKTQNKPAAFSTGRIYVGLRTSRTCKRTNPYQFPSPLPPRSLRSANYWFRFLIHGLSSAKVYNLLGETPWHSITYTYLWYRICPHVSVAGSQRTGALGLGVEGQGGVGWKETQTHGLRELMPAIQFLRTQFPLD